MRAAACPRSTSDRVASEAMTRGIEHSTATADQSPTTAAARRRVRRDDRRHADTALSATRVAAAAVGKPWNRSGGQRKTTCTLRAPKTNPDPARYSGQKDARHGQQRGHPGWNEQPPSCQQHRAHPHD